MMKPMWKMETTHDIRCESYGDAIHNYIAMQIQSGHITGIKRRITIPFYQDGEYYYIFIGVLRLNEKRINGKRLHWHKITADDYFQLARDLSNDITNLKTTKNYENENTNSQTIDSKNN